MREPCVSASVGLVPCRSVTNLERIHLINLIESGEQLVVDVVVIVVAG